MRIDGPDVEDLRDRVAGVHGELRDAIVAACERADVAELAAVDREDETDTQYAVDRVGEERLVEAFEPVARHHPMRLLAEGLSPEGVLLPRGTSPADALWRVIVDPIDGTRGLMYQKRAAWILTGVAPERGDATRLRDVVVAVQTEIPLVKQHLADQLTAVRGRGVRTRRVDRVSGGDIDVTPRPSRAPSIDHGFATVARYFPGVREELAAIDEEVVAAVLGPPVENRAACFEDQYLSSAGQLYELVAGHDRFVADLRPLFNADAVRGERPRLLCCHPYDLCTALIAEEAGVIVTDPAGAPLDAPLDVVSDVGWVGYANASIRDRVEPALHRALRRRGLL